MAILDQLGPQLAAATKLLRALRQPPQELVAVDFDPAATRCVRLKVSGAEVEALAADILPALDLGDEAQVKAFELPKPLAARYVAICIPGSGAIVKLLNFPGALDDKAEEQIREHMGVGEGAFRFGYRLISQTRSETRLLTVAIPEAQVQAACAVFPTGLPAPTSVEVSGLAVMSAFLHGPAAAAQDEAVGVVEFGARDTYFAFFKKRELVLIRKFDFGHLNLLERLERGMGADRQTALNIMRDQSFDISQLIKDMTDPFIKQLVISQHFVERRENCHISRIFVPDDPSITRVWLNDIKAAVGLEVGTWHPFEGVKLLPEALSGKLEASRCDFAAAVGAALAKFEEGRGGSGG
ncbi:MAG: hypothetical protein HYV35_05335 [Lentisphaerae bacterium]|nr:hypothetical protein [Lentisphaerota bacterium]